MRSTIKTICIELAKYIQKQQIQCFVLNGVGPELLAVGRDLDVYVPTRREGLSLLAFFHALLKILCKRSIACYYNKAAYRWGYRRLLDKLEKRFGNY